MTMFSLLFLLLFSSFGFSFLLFVQGLCWKLEYTSCRQNAKLLHAPRPSKASGNGSWQDGRRDARHASFLVVPRGLWGGGDIQASFPTERGRLLGNLGDAFPGKPWSSFKRKQKLSGSILNTCRKGLKKCVERDY